MPKNSTAKSKKSVKIFQNYLTLICQFLGGRSYKPLYQEELSERLSVPPVHHDLFHKALNTLIREGKITLKEKRYLLCASDAKIVTGILRMHPRGFGFLQPDDPIQFSEDIFIPKHLTKNAVDGDSVEVLINEESKSEKGPEGKVFSILKRSRTHIAGTVWHISEKGEVLVHVPLFGASKKVTVTPIDERELQIGDRLIMKVLDWGSENSATHCEMSHYIGHISDPSCDVRASIEEFDLRSDFPSTVVQEAKLFGSKVSAKDIKSRTDLRSLECFTIDPDTAKDFDDALSLNRDENGNYHLGVHIADVSHYVKPGTALDNEAKLRCNSTYFPGFCLPMLPHELSSELCSLKAHVNRLTLSVMMSFDPQGDLLHYKIFRSVIKSSKRFTYKQAKQVLDGKTKSKFAPTLQLMVELCHLLKKKRYERGSIEFSLPEVIIKIDEKGDPTGFERIEYDITHQLVEEFMLKANETVATYLSEKGEKLTYRVHDQPAEESLKEFATLARAFGFHLPSKPTTHDFQKLFDKAASTIYATQLATSFIRSMKLAYYSPTNGGHYGLSLEYYCHFTSPIRRYVDLVVHRIVCGDTHELESLSMTCHGCSEQERISAKAEQSTTLLKKLRYLKKLYEEDPTRKYQAVVTRIKNMGLIFDITDLMMDSFLHISELEDDYFVYDEDRLILRGSRTGKEYSCGKKIEVVVTHLDFITLESKWALALNNQNKRSRKEKRSKK
ncbi:MAG: ribonuclease R [Chlamydiales bacterium]|nr:ribonuclease R [Chlamydiales bacterium]